MTELVEGVDYIFDRYAFLGLEQGTSDEAVEMAIRTRKSENHPDRYTKASKEAREVAARLWALTEKCEEILSDPARRKSFDVTLSTFQDEKPDLVSVDGTPRLSMNYTRVSLHDLLGDAPDTAERERLGDSMVGFSTTQLTIMEHAYKSDPTNAEIRDAYRGILVNGIVHYGLQEDCAWEQAGVHIGHQDKGRSALFVDDIGKRVQERIEEIGDSLEGRVQQHFGLLASGLAKPLMLTGTVGEAAGAAGRELVTAEDAANHVRQQFKQRTHRLEQLVDKRQQMIAKLLDTMQIWPLSKQEADNGMPRTFLMREDEKGVLRCFVTLGVDQGAITVDHQTFNGKTVEELKEIAGDAPSIAVETHGEVRDFAMYATFAWDKLAAEKEGPARG